MWDAYLPAFPKLGLSPVELDVLVSQNDLFEQTAWYRYIPYSLRLVQPYLPAVELRATVASPRLFELLGVSPAIGQVKDSWQARSCSVTGSGRRGLAVMQA